MIIRIVKMSFHPYNIDKFIDLFDSVQNKIKNSEGCERLDLLQDQDNPSLIFTYSYWRAPQYLENYRTSKFFEQTWSKTKVLFNDKPEAWSTAILTSNTITESYE